MRAAVAALALATLLAVVGTAAGASAPNVAQAPPVVTSGVDYSPAADGSLLLDVTEPAGAATAQPAVVLVHGGGWTSGDRTQVAPDALAFAEAGMVAFSIEYDENGVNRWRDELVDVQTAVRWVQANAATYRVDPARIGLFGSSAGGNLVMLVATQGLGDATAPPVRAIATWSGPSDLSTLTSTDVDATQLTGAPGSVIGADTPAGCTGDPDCIGVIDPEAIEAYLGCTIEVCPQTYIDSSPAFQVEASTPPMLLVSAQTDLVPAEQSYEMVNALSAAGVASSILLVAGEGHAESLRDTALEPTTAFFTRYLVDGADPRTATTTPPSTVAGSQPLPPVDAANRLPTPAPPANVAALLAQGPTEDAGGRSVGLVVGAALVIAIALVLVAFLVRRRRR